MSSKPKSAFILWESVIDKIYSPEALQRLGEDLEILPDQIDADNWRDHRSSLAEAEFIFSGWGMALLDVTATEPNNADSPLWDLPNVVLTPHIAGSTDNECRRMGQYMVEEWERYRDGQPLQHEVTAELLKTMA